MSSSVELDRVVSCDIPVGAAVSTVGCLLTNTLRTLFVRREILKLLFLVPCAMIVCRLRACGTFGERVEDGRKGEQILITVSGPEDT